MNPDTFRIRVDRPMNELPVIGSMPYTERVVRSPGGSCCEKMYGGKLFDVQKNDFGER